jgi:hypothetical protein
MHRRWSWMTVGLSVALLGAAPVGSAAPRHDVHASHTRAVVENGTVLWKVRCFTDDLEKALRAHARRPTFALKTDRAADSLFTAYFNARVSVSADGRALTARLVQTGTDADPLGGTVHWYLLQLDTPAAPRRLTVRNLLMQELFPDQMNIVVVLSMPGETRYSLYFAEGNLGAQTIALR